MTSTQPTQEQIKKFWKWYGWWLGDEIEGEAWHHPNFKDTQPKAPGYALQVEHNYTYYAPSIDLNNLFKYAVPKLKGEWTIAIANGHDFPYVATVKNLGSSTEVGDTPALALFWALWRVKEGGNNGISRRPM